MLHIAEYTAKVLPWFTFNWHNDVIFHNIQRLIEGEIKRLMIWMPPRHGKLCADSTPVLTAEGWKTHGELTDKDYVVHPSGRLVRVLAVSPPDEATLAVSLTNGEVIKCHPNHEWVVYDRSAASWRVVETRELEERTLWSGDRTVFQFPEISPVQFPTKDLPATPYVLGAWLGDGTTGKSTITHSPKDRAVIEHIASLGYGVSTVHTHSDTGVETSSFGGTKRREGRMTRELKEAGVFRDKHIPEIYKLSSVEQRLQLLAGLIDTDGHVEGVSNRVRIVTVSDRLRDDILDIATSLGFRPYCNTQKPVVSTSGIVGRRPVHYVGFQPNIHPYRSSSQEHREICRSA